MQPSESVTGVKVASRDADPALASTPQYAVLEVVNFATRDVLRIALASPRYSGHFRLVRWQWVYYKKHL
jgi:hypothetical protein